MKGMIESVIPDAMRHAESDPQREICGLVVVFKGRVRYERCRNLAEAPTEQFVIDPEDYARVDDMGEILAVVHSHPNANPAPSQADRVGIEETGLPWAIVNPAIGRHTLTFPSGYRAPLVGREWCHGVLDCYAIIRDYYRDEKKLIIPNFHRPDLWWKNGGNLYLDNFEKAGFVEVDRSDMRPGDGLLMAHQASVPNHGAIYLGGMTILHHVYGRLSSRDVFGGYWQRCLRHVMRHISCL
jgi:proteasome lid subunit RPN8/RPN11